MSDRKAYDPIKWAFVLLILGAVISFTVLFWEPEPAPAPKPEVKLPTAEEAGKASGSSARGFLRGFTDGWRNRK